MLANCTPSSSQTVPLPLTTSEEESELKDLLGQARLYGEAVFSRRPAFHKPGEEAIATVLCPVGHALTFSARELREAIDNPDFNDRDVVPCLCKHCAYPGQLRVRTRRATFHHRIALLSKIYPRVAHVNGFDIGEVEPETFACGETFADGSPHPVFAVSFNRLQKASGTKHHCYICAIKAGVLLDPPELTVDHVAGRLQQIADLIDERCLDTRKRRRVIPTSVQVGDRIAGSLTNSTTNFVFSCHQPEHPSIVTTAELYFRPAKGGFCRLCLQEAGLTSTRELMDAPIPVGSRRRAKNLKRASAEESDA